MSRYLIALPLLVLMLTTGCTATTPDCEYTRTVTTMIDQCVRNDERGMCVKTVKVPTQQKVCSDEPEPDPVFNPQS